MQRIKILSLALIAICALAAVSAASASAAECPGTGSGVALCSEGHEQKGTFAFSGEQLAGSRATIFELPQFLPINCSSKTKFSKGSFVAGSGGKLEISGMYMEFSACNSSEGGCREFSIVVDGNEGKDSGPGLSANLTNTSAIRFVGGGTKKRWTIMNIFGECAESGTTPVKGEQLCELSESTVEKVKHLLICRTTGSELIANTAKEEFEIEAELGLSSGKKWSLQKA